MKTLALLATVAAASAALPALAEEVTLTEPLAAGSLHEGTLDMVAYWIEAPGGALEVTAAFRSPLGDAEPMLVTMAMADGDAVAFGMPGHEGTLYRFARDGRSVDISATPVGRQIASAD